MNKKAITIIQEAEQILEREITEFRDGILKESTNDIYYKAYKIVCFEGFYATMMTMLRGNNVKLARKIVSRRVGLLSCYFEYMGWEDTTLGTDYDKVIYDLSKDGAA